MNRTNDLLFGFAEADITPEGPVVTIGFGRADETSRGVMSGLCAQVAVWRKDDGPCCLAAIDHIGFSRAHADELRDFIGAALGTPRERVMLCFSHTHAGPNDSAEPEWFRMACGRIVRCAKEALGNMRHVRAAWGNAETDIGVNRRAGNEALDRRIGILKLQDAETGTPLLLLLRLTAHANVLKADNYLVSPDFFGAVRLALHEKYGCPVMATQGASGNVSPKYFQSRLTPPDAADERYVRSETALSEMAQTVIRDAAPVIDALVPKAGERLEMYVRRIALAADVPTPARAAEIAEEARALCGIDGASWLSEVARLNGAGIREQREEVEAQYLLIGDGCLCGVPNEIMCEFALRASDFLGNGLFHLGGYTNGCTGYFPTEEEFDKGGYEVYWSMLTYYIYFHRVFPFRRDSAAALIRFVVDNAPCPKNGNFPAVLSSFVENGERA